MEMHQVGRSAAAIFCSTLFAALTSCTSARSRPSSETVAASSDPAASPTAGTPSRIPGDDPSIQRWFLKVGQAQVAFDNALYRAEQGIAKHRTG